MNINKNYSMIYEVNIKAKNEIASEYFNWLKDIHIKKFLNVMDLSLQLCIL
jgi:hypothetical protein